MKKDNTSDRRNFLKSAGAALVAAAVPAAVLGQKNDARPGSGNNLKQMIIFGGVSEPDPLLPGVFGQACFQFQMQAVIGGVGYATISDPIFTGINSHMQIQNGRIDINDIYVFQGIIRNSQSSELIGKAVVVKVQVLSDDNCNVSLTVENTPVNGLLLPAVQKIRTPIYG